MMSLSYCRAGQPNFAARALTSVWPIFAIVPFSMKFLASGRADPARAASYRVHSKILYFLRLRGRRFGRPSTVQALAMIEGHR
jgi:hypothetical protein